MLDFRRLLIFVDQKNGPHKIHYKYFRFSYIDSCMHLKCKENHYLTKYERINHIGEGERLKPIS